MKQRRKKNSEISEGGPKVAGPKRHFLRKKQDDYDVLDDRVAERLDELAGKPKEEEPISRVEQAMRRNAPDLAGAPEEEVLAAEARRNAHETARWPRPRIVALLLVWMVAWLHPASTLRVFVLCVMLFLVASVSFGPERARDGSGILWKGFLKYWKVELTLLSRLVDKVRRRFETLFRTAQ